MVINMVYVFLANGFEEIEAITPIDMLRRSEKDVIIAGVGGKEITGAHDIVINADINCDEIILDENLEMIILPGGTQGTINLKNDAYVNKAIEYCNKNGIFICAICAAPSILGNMGLLKGKKATCYPGFEQQMTGAEINGESVVRDGKIITAKGAGVSIEFGKELVSVLCGAEKAENLCSLMQCI